MSPLSTETMPVGISMAIVSGTQRIPVQRTSSWIGRSGQAGLHQVPVAEQHRVGDDAEEQGAGDAPEDRQRDRVAGRDRTEQHGEQPEPGGDEVEHRGELVGALVEALLVAVDPGHLRHARRTSFDDVSLPGDPGPAPTDRDAEGDHARRDERDRGDLAGPCRRGHESGDEGTPGEQQEDEPLEPAVAESDLAATGRDPQEEPATGRPLDEHGGTVDSDHTVTTARWWSTRLRGSGPSAVGDHDVLEPHAPPTRHVDARARSRTHCRPRAAGRCPRRCRGPRGPRRRCRGRCGG